MVLPDTDGVHSAGGGPPPAPHKQLTVPTLYSALTLVLTVTGNFTVICTTSLLPCFTLSDTETLSLAEPPSLFSVAQDVSCNFKDGALVSIAIEN